MSKRNKTKSVSAAAQQASPDSTAPPLSQLHLAIDEHIAPSAIAVDELDEINAPEVSLEQADQIELPDQLSVAASIDDAKLAESVLLADVVRLAPSTPSNAHSSTVQEEVKQNLGERFRSIRESRGISREEMSRRLRVSPRVIQDIESDQWDRLGASVYVRGHLTSYAKILGVPTVVVSLALQSLEPPAPLALTVSAPASDSWWSRYSSAATYVVLTLLLAIPIFTMVPKRGVNSPIPLVRSMEDNEVGPSIREPENVSPLLPQPSSSTPLSAVDFVGPPERASGSAALNPPLLPTQNSEPLMASMTPIGNMAQKPELGAGAHRIELSFTEDSWLELVDSNGTKLAYGIARAGETRQHLVSTSVAMSIGNVGGVRLNVDGEAVDLQQFARLNVARLKLFEGQPTIVPPPR